MELLSTTLNTVIKINDKIPIDILKIDNLAINNNLDNVVYAENNSGNVNIRDMESSQHMASAITKE